MAMRINFPGATQHAPLPYGTARSAALDREIIINTSEFQPSFLDFDGNGDFAPGAPGEPESPDAPWNQPIIVKSSDNTVEVLESPGTYDLSIKKTLDGLELEGGGVSVMESTSQDAPSASEENPNYIVFVPVGSGSPSGTATAITSEDETVNVTEISGGYDLSIQLEITRATNRENAIEAKIDQSVEQDTGASADEDSVTISTSSINLSTGLISGKTVAFPTASETSAGVWDAAMFKQFAKNVADIEALLNLAQTQGSGRVALAHLNGSTDPAAISAAFNAVYPGAILDKDTVIDLDNTGFEWLYSNGSWYNLTVQPLSLASASQDGMVSDNPEDGGITYQTPGKGQLIGWSNLKARVSTAEGNISGLQSSLSAAQQGVSDLSARMGEAESDISELQDSAVTVKQETESTAPAASAANPNAIVFVPLP